MIISAEALTDSYKIGMAQLHHRKVDDLTIDILNSYSNFTPRKNAYMDFSLMSDDRIVVYGTRHTFQSVVDAFNTTFFATPRKAMLARTKRRLLAHFGSIEEHTSYLNDLENLHKLGYLPIEVRAIEEGTRLPIGIPLFTVKSTVDGFAWLVNYIETLSSGLFWPMTNTATKIEQFYLQAKHYGELSAPAEVVANWLPICVHEFGMRGYWGPEAAVRASSCHNLFFKGSDTIGVLDFFEKYYGYDMDKDEAPAISIRASEHADISRLLSEYRYRAQQSVDRTGGFDVVAHVDDSASLEAFDIESLEAGQCVRVYAEYFTQETGMLLTVDTFDAIAKDVLENTEYYVLRDLVHESTGIMAYVSDTENFYRLLNVYARSLKDDILNRKPRADGQPAIFTFRPDSSRHTPLNVICGYDIIELDGDPAEIGDRINYESEDDYVVFKDSAGTYFLACDGMCVDQFTLYEKIEEAEALGSLRILWDIFGGSLVQTQAGQMKMINPAVGLIYGEAISQTHQMEIYERMISMGFSATNVLMGKGSYATLENNTRDLFSMSYKQTFSEAKVGGMKVVDLRNGLPIHRDSVKPGVCYMDEDVKLSMFGEETSPYFVLENPEEIQWDKDGNQTGNVSVITIPRKQALGERVNLSQQKNPLGDASKKSAKGLLRVEKIGTEYTLHQDQTPEQEQTGELKLLLRDGTFHNEQSLADIKAVYNS